MDDKVRDVPISKTCPTELELLIGDLSSEIESYRIIKSIINGRVYKLTGDTRLNDDVEDEHLVYGSSLFNLLRQHIAQFKVLNEDLTQIQLVLDANV